MRILVCHSLSKTVQNLLKGPALIKRLTSHVKLLAVMGIAVWRNW